MSQSSPPPPPPSPFRPPDPYAQPVPIAQSGRPQTRKEARADAKAAKARAKALRPWYRKKRYWLLAALAVIVVAVVVESNTSTTEKQSNANVGVTTTSNGVSKGAGANDASADVTNPTLGPPDALGFRPITFTVTNHSSKRSNYLIEASLESPDGATQYDSTVVPVNNLEPGQTTTASGVATAKDVPDSAVLVLKQVQRFASS